MNTTTLDPIVSQMQTSLQKSGYTAPVNPAKASLPVANGGDWYSQLKANAPAAPVKSTTRNLRAQTAEVQHEADSTGQPTMASQAGSEIKDSFKAGIDQGKEGYEEAMNSGGNPLTAAEGAVKFGAGAVNAVFSPIAPLTKPIGEGIGKVSDLLGSIPAVQRFAQSNAGKTTARVADDVNNISTIAGAVAGTKGAPEVAAKVGEVADKVGTAAGNVADKVSAAAGNGADKVTAAASDAKNAATDAASTYYKEQSINDWTKPAETPKPAYSKAAQVFRNAATQGHNIADTLVNNGIKLADNIQNGVYATKDAADLLRADTGRLSGDLLRPSLETANYSTPKISIEDILRNAKSTIAADSESTLGDKASLANKVNAETALLKEKYPDGLSLTDLHDNKITYSKNAGHNPLGTQADNLSAKANDALSTAFKNTLERSAPPDVPVKELNAELSKRYQAASYLEALNGKTVPKGIMSKIAQTTAKIAGAVGGESLGGGLLGGVGGYHLGGMVEKFIENMTNPVKAHFLNNLELTNPDAFSRIKQYLGDSEVEKMMRPQLPAPTPLGTERNPIITPSPTTYESPAQQIRRQPIPDQLNLPPAGQTSARIPLNRAGTAEATLENMLGNDQIKGMVKNRNTKLTMSQGLSRFKANGGS